MENTYIIAIDLGTERTRVVAGFYDEKQAYGLRVMHMEDHESKGMKRGAVNQSDEAMKVVSNLIMGAEKKIKEKQTGKKTTNPSIKVCVCTNINGNEFRSHEIQARKNLAGSKSISMQTLRELKDVATTVAENNYPDEDVLRLTVSGYMVDNDPMSMDVIGRRGDKLTGKYVSISATKKNIENVKSAFQRYMPDAIYASTSAKAQIVLQPDQINEGVVLVDLGASTTGVATFYQGSLRSEVSIPFGSDTITKDIKKGLGIAEDENAEYLKCWFGIIEEAKSQKFIEAELPNHKKVTFQAGLLSYCIRARVEEIAAYVYSAIPDNMRQTAKQVILTGGGAKLKGVTEVFENMLGKNTIIATTHQEISDEDCQNYAAALGMASMFAREQYSLGLQREKEQEREEKQKREQAEESEIENGVEETTKELRVEETKPEEEKEAEEKPDKEKRSEPDAVEEREEENGTEKPKKKNLFRRFTDFTSSLMTDEFENK